MDLWQLRYFVALATQQHYGTRIPNYDCQAMNTRTLLACGFALCALAACGGGTGPVTPPPVQVLGSLQLSSSANQLLTSADTQAEGLTITARARDTTGVAMAGVNVSFAAVAATLSATSSMTDAAGLARVILTTGGDPANRSAQISATSGAASAAALTVPVVGTRVVIGGPDLVAYAGTYQFPITVVNAAGEGIPQTLVDVRQTPPPCVPTYFEKCVQGYPSTDDSGLYAHETYATSNTSFTLDANALFLSAGVSKRVAVVEDRVTMLQPASTSEVPQGIGPVTFTVRVQRDGVDVADGWPLRVETSFGILSAVNFPTVGGRASFTLSSNEAGRAYVAVYSEVPPYGKGRAAGAAVELYFR